MILKKICENSNIKNVVFISGGSKGLGKYLLINLFNISYLLITTSSIKSNINKFNFYLRKKNIFNVLILKLDLKKIFEIKSCINYIKKKIAIPLFLINNAGIKADDILLKMKYDNWHDVINVNLNSVYYITSFFLKKMILFKFGRIINIGSIISDVGNSGQSNYSASKSGIIGFTKSLALELMDFKITVNVISPGFMKTNMTRNFILKSSLSRSNFLKMKNVLYLIKFFMSEKSNYITGQIFNLNKLNYK